MDAFVPFGSPDYLILLGILFLCRAADFLSTWVGTPSLAMEGNPFVRKMGWKGSAAFNLLMCVLLARWPFVAMVLSTTSLLVASRNFQSAWLMRSMGEAGYMDLVGRMLMIRGTGLYLACSFGQAVPVALIGTAVMLFSEDLVPFAIGMGVLAYAFVVLFFSILSVVRLPRPRSTRMEL